MSKFSEWMNFELNIFSIHFVFILIAFFLCKPSYFIACVIVVYVSLLCVCYKWRLNNFNVTLFALSHSLLYLHESNQLVEVCMGRAWSNSFRPGLILILYGPGPGLTFFCRLRPSRARFLLYRSERNINFILFCIGLAFYLFIIFVQINSHLFNEISRNLILFDILQRNAFKNRLFSFIFKALKL